MDAVLALILGFGGGLIIGTILAIEWHDKNLRKMKEDIGREIMLRQLAIDAQFSGKSMRTVNTEKGLIRYE